MGFFSKNNNTKAPQAGGNISVLMCAGRRVGKTSIMAAMQDNMTKQFMDGTISVDIKQQSGDGSNPLDVFRQKQMKAFRANWDSPFYYAEESNQTGKSGESTASETTNVYMGDVRVKDANGVYRLVNTVSFRDPRGEDFSDTVSAQRREEVKGWIAESQVIIIAVDTPRLMECDENGRVGAFHEEFNKPEEITNLIQQAWQGNKQERLILFVPLKCELYVKEGRGADIVSRVQEGYRSLITFVRTSQSALCSMAIVPCETMGGLEFRKFERIGGYVEGKKPVGFRSVYAYRRELNQNGIPMRYFRPRNCEQPLLYVLMFVFGLRKKGKTSDGIFGFLSNMPKYEDIVNAHKRISDKTVRDEQQGFVILNDPQGFLNDMQSFLNSLLL